MSSILTRVSLVLLMAFELCGCTTEEVIPPAKPGSSFENLILADEKGSASPTNNREAGQPTNPDSSDSQ